MRRLLDLGVSAAGLLILSPLFALLAVSRSNCRRAARSFMERAYVEKILPEKLRIDLNYLDRRTFRSDLGLIVRTIAAIFG
jgi:lipopolysaccharide/colanic/teichoic acid biosynthesis glycosyltransferase